MITYNTQTKSELRKNQKLRVLKTRHTLPILETTAKSVQTTAEV